MLTVEEAKKILQLEQETELTAAKVTKAYKRAALKYHPDKYKGDPEHGHNMMQDINAAKEFFETLFSSTTETKPSNVESPENKSTDSPKPFKTNKTKPTEQKNEKSFEQENIYNFFKNKWENQANHIQTDIDQLKKMNANIDKHPGVINKLNTILKSFILHSKGEFDPISELVSQYCQDFRDELEDLINYIQDKEDHYLCGKIFINPPLLHIANLMSYATAWEMGIQQMEIAARQSHPLAILEIISWLLNGNFYQPSLELTKWAKTKYEYINHHFDIIMQNYNSIPSIQTSILSLKYLLDQQFNILSSTPDELYQKALDNRLKVFAAFGGESKVQHRNFDFHPMHSEFLKMPKPKL